MNRRTWMARSGALGVAALTFRPVCGEPLRAAPETAVLDVVRAAHRDHPVQLSLAQLQALPQREIRTALPAWFGMQGEFSWRGPSLKAVLDHMDAQAHVGVHVGALNGYSAEIPARDLEVWDPLLAWSRDGAPIAIREKGPLIVIYPFDGHPELDTVVYANRSVWQVNRLEPR